MKKLRKNYKGEYSCDECGFEHDERLNRMPDGTTKCDDCFEREEEKWKK